MDRAVANARAAAESTAIPPLEQAAYRSSLAGVLQARFQRRGELRDLDEAIEYARAALAATPERHTAHSERLSRLSLALMARAERAARTDPLTGSGQEGELGEAGEADESGAVDTAHSIEETGGLSDVSEAIALARAAAQSGAPGRPERAWLLSNLSTALVARANLCGKPTDLDLAEAVTAAHTALAATPPGHPDRPMHLSNLANALRARHARLGRPADLDTAVDLLREAIEDIKPGHPDRATLLFNLAAALQRRHAGSHHAADRAEALAYWREATESATAPTWVRLRAAEAWATWAWHSADHAAARAGALAAVRLLPELAWHGLDRPTREQHLDGWTGLASLAASASLAVDRPDTAIEALEQGRGILWTQLLQQADSLADLAAARPDLAAALHRVRHHLNHPRPAALPLHGPPSA